MATVTISLRAQGRLRRQGASRGWPSPLPARAGHPRLIAVTMTRRRGRPSTIMGLDFFTSSTTGRPPDKSSARWPSSTARCSASRIALLIAVPVSIGIALFMTEVAPRWLRRPIVYVIDLLAVVPSVVFGLWGVLVLVRRHQGRLRLARTTPFGGIPVARHALRRRQRQRSGVHDRRADPGHHDHPDHHLAHPRGVRHRARRATGKAPSPWAPPAGR